MTSAALAYAPDFVPRGESEGPALAASIFAEGAQTREDLRDDALAAGLAVHDCAGLAALFEGEPRVLGAVVLLDCPEVDAAGMAALARLDMRAARAGAQLVIATGLAALDAVFACCDQSAPQILVDPTRAERTVALGRAVARSSGSRLREPNPDDRLTLLRLSEQVDAIAERLGSFGGPGFGLVGDDRALSFESPRRKFVGQGDVHRVVPQATLQAVQRGPDDVLDRVPLLVNLELPR